MKRFIKKHRYTCVLLLFFILLVVIGLKLQEVLIPDEGKATYGERLKDINKHPLSDELYNKIDEEFKKNSSITKIDHRVQGKILNYYFTFEDKVSVKDAKAVGDELIKLIDEDILEYYSIQIYLIKDNEQLNNFPIIGMKDPKSKTISWTKDREIITESDKNEE